ncbi:MAG: hypothetical protein ACTSPY_07570 [Candidatus Helarchaeota archaeon]
MTTIPIFIRKYAWLLGQFVQNCLLEIEGIEKPKIEKMQIEYPFLSIGELINMQRDTHGVSFDWDNVICQVKYKGNVIDITKAILEIVWRNTDKEWINNIGFDTRGFDINSACREASKLIINKIIKNETV